MKLFLGCVVFTYALFGVADYFAAADHFDKERCEAWMKHPWYLHVIMPGPGNYCLDNYFK